jgi:hypothetical protein
MFDSLKTKPERADVSSVETPSSTNDPNEFRGTIVVDAIDLTDGKTKTCNRTKTFDAFVLEQDLSEVLPRKPSGNIWGVTRAVSKFKSPLRKSSGKADKKQKTKDVAEKYVSCHELAT